MMQRRLTVLFGVVAVAMVGCGDDDPPPAPPADAGPACSIEEQTGCEDGLWCEPMPGGEVGCFSPITVSGQVVDAVTGEPIEGATVVAQDANGAAVSGVAVTDATGAYEIVVSAPRDADGNVVDDTLYTLRADAAGYETFPKPPREAIPVDMTEGAGDPPVVESAATEVALLALPAGGGDGVVSGTIAADVPGGALVVVAGQTAIADRDGNFTVFNVPAGSHEVRAYLTGTELGSTTVDVAAGGTVEGVTLESEGPATATVSGSVQIVNAPGGSETSVILVVEDTFEPNVIRGEAPAGLRAYPVDGGWEIEGVPSGSYVVLAAFENDLLVRDPDESIGGTEIQRVTVGGSDVDAGSFKVTEALAVIAPGADGAEGVSGTPTFVWDDDSSEAGYLVEVFDALGELIWSTEGNFDPGGNDPASVEYGGPALEVGMYYQFRATSYDGGGAYLSTTENLKGVFWYEGP